MDWSIKNPRRCVECCSVIPEEKTEKFILKSGTFFLMCPYCQNVTYPIIKATDLAKTGYDGGERQIFIEE